MAILPNNLILFIMGTNYDMLKHSLVFFEEYKREYEAKAKQYDEAAHQMREAAKKYAEEVNRVEQLINKRDNENNS